MGEKVATNFSILQWMQFGKLTPSTSLVEMATQLSVINGTLVHRGMLQAAGFPHRDSTVKEVAGRRLQEMWVG